MDLVTLGAGCFWCVEAIFQQVAGISDISSGYSGGFTKNPNYEEVTYGDSGHFEVIEIVFDKTKTNEYDNVYANQPVKSPLNF